MTTSGFVLYKVLPSDLCKKSWYAQSRNELFSLRFSPTWLLYYGGFPFSSDLRSRQQAQTSRKLSLHLHGKNWASWDNGDGNGERFSCDGASLALKRCLQLVALELCFIYYRIWAQRVARRQSFPESPSLWKSVKGNRKY